MATGKLSPPPLIESGSAPEQRRWGSRVDILVYGIGLVALIVYVLHGFDGYFHRDHAIYTYAGQQVVEGSPPYVGILNRSGPLAHLLPAIGVAAARLGGFDDVLGVRLLFMIFSVTTVCAVYVLGRELFASRLTGLVAATVFLSFFGFIEYASNGPREKTPMVLLLVCTLLALTKRSWFAAGVGVSLTTLLWQPAFLVAGAAVISAMIALPTAQRTPAVVRVVTGGLIPTAVCVVYFVLAGAFEEFIDGFLLINARYTTPDPLLTNFAIKWDLLLDGYGVTLWIMLAGLSALAILTIQAIRRGNAKVPARLPIAALGAASFVALGWSFRDFNSWPDAFVFLPLAAIGIGSVVKRAADRLPAKAGTGLTLACAALAVGAALIYSTTQRNNELDVQRDAVAGVLNQLPSDASILSIGAPQPLVLSGKTNATRYQMFSRGLDRYVGDTWPGGLTGFAEWVGQQQPTIISFDRLGAPSWLSEVVGSDYQPIGQVPGWTWFVRRSVGGNVQLGPTGT